MAWLIDSSNNKEAIKDMPGPLSALISVIDDHLDKFRAGARAVNGVAMTV